MLVTERMQALGDHAKSSRQPPLKERRPPRASQGAAEQNVIDEEILENGAALENAAAVIVGGVTPQTVVHENGNGAVAEITPEEEAAVLVTVATVLAKIGPQSATADDNGTRPEVVQDDDRAAKRAIIHEWENWSALHSDELNDPNVAEYFFRHLQAKKLHLLDSEFKDIRSIVRKHLVGLGIRISQ
jgi:hypothetical protein